MSYLFHFYSSFKHNFCHFNYYFLIEFSRSLQEPSFFFSLLNTLKNHISLVFHAEHTGHKTVSSEIQMVLKTLSPLFWGQMQT